MTSHCIPRSLWHSVRPCSHSAPEPDPLPLLHTEPAICKALVLFAALASGYVRLRRAIKAMHVDLMKTTSAEARDRASAIQTNEAESTHPGPTAGGSEVLDPDVPDRSDTEQVGQPSVWRELQLVTVAWLGQSLTAATAAATGVILGTAPEVEAGEMLPNPVLMT